MCFILQHVSFCIGYVHPTHAEALIMFPQKKRGPHYALYPLNATYDLIKTSFIEEKSLHHTKTYVQYTNTIQWSY